MKLEFKMTNRDKKLLVFLAIFVIVVGFGYWGIRPAVYAMMDLKNDISTEEDRKAINDLKLAELPMYEMENEEYEEDIIKARKNYFEILTSDQVDRMMTGIAIDYSLYSYDLNIIMPEDFADLQPYKYSNKALEDAEMEEYYAELAEEEEKKAKEKEESGKSSNEKELDMYFEEDMADYSIDNSLTGIYAVRVEMRLGGEEENLQKLIDDYSETDKKIQIVSYDWDGVRNMFYDEETGDYEIDYERVLNISMMIYMCEE